MVHTHTQIHTILPCWNRKPQGRRRDLAYEIPDFKDMRCDEHQSISAILYTLLCVFFNI